MNRIVPNSFPVIEPPSSARVAVVGESPGVDESYQGLPFVGESGRFLNNALERVGLTRSQMFVGNVCQVMPHRGSFHNIEWNSEEVQAGIRQLRVDLERFRPTMVLCLGNAALHLLRHGNTPPPRKRQGGLLLHDWPSKVGDWRGSLFESAFVDVKAMATYHPAACLREFSLQAYVEFDLKRLAQESKSAELVLPKRQYLICRTREDVMRLKRLALPLTPISCDIEGGPGLVTSIAFANSPDFALVIPLAHVDGTSVWNEEDEIWIWERVKEVLENAQVPKLFQNGSYDSFALLWTLGIVVRNFHDDAMLAWWECYPELDKGLDVQASILTKEPFYKPDLEKSDKKAGEESERTTRLKFDSDEEFWRYNGLDACVTLECFEQEMKRLSPAQQSHYRFNMELMPGVLYMMARGIKVDKERVKEEQRRAQEQVWELQGRIDLEMARTEQHDNSMLFDIYHGAVEDETAFAKIVLSCLGGKNPRVRVPVVEERWQPMRWQPKLKGKEPGFGKWVKDGKVCCHVDDVKWKSVGIPNDCAWHEDAEPPSNERAIQLCYWLKPVPRTVEKLIPFTPTALADCEPHILDSCQEQWKEVKRIWKELKNGQANSISNRSDRRTCCRGEGSTDSDGSRTGRSMGNVALLGRLSLSLSLAVNASSTNAGGDAQVFLYEVCGLPKVWKDERTGKYSREGESDRKERLEARAGLSANPAGKKLATDQQALDKLYAHTEDVRVLWVLQQRRLKKVVTDLDTEFDADGRMRASISLVKETGRMAESASPLKTGLNRQALNKDLRCIAVADEGYELCQCDLEGADSWTVACECAALGDRTMLEDLLAGLKPAKGLCYGYFHPEDYAKLPAGEIKTRLKGLEQPHWLYAGAKSVTHGSSYGAGWQTTIDTILKYSMSDLPIELGDTKPILLTKEQVDKLRNAFFLRYPGVKRWHEKEARDLLDKGYIETSVGHRRKIFGRKAEWKGGRKVANHDTLKEVLASKPQFYTTHICKKALHKLCCDPENRRADGSFVVEPLAAIHDALVVQWRKEDREFGKRKMREWFWNPICIAGIEVVIPFDAKICSNWRMDEKAGDAVESL